MRQRGWDVLGAYMSPVNDSYGKKVGIGVKRGGGGGGEGGGLTNWEDVLRCACVGGQRHDLRSRTCRTPHHSVIPFSCNL